MVELVADQIATRFGVLGRELSLAVLHTVELTAREGVDALDRADRRLRGGTAIDLAPAEAPGQRWRALLESLFPAATFLVGRHIPPPPGLSELESEPGEERVIRKVITAAAAFLLAQSTTLEDTCGLRAMVHEPAENETTDLDELLQVAATASAVLLDHAKDGTWRVLLASFQRPRRPESAQRALRHGPVARHSGVGNGAEAAAAEVRERATQAARVTTIGYFGAFSTGKSTLLDVLAVLNREIDEAFATDRIPEIYAFSDGLLETLLRQRAAHGARAPRVRYLHPLDRPPHPAGLAEACPGGLQVVELPGLGSVPETHGNHGVLGGQLRDYLAAVQRSSTTSLDRLIVADAGEATEPHLPARLVPAAEHSDDGTVPRLPGLRGCEVILVPAVPPSRRSLRSWRLLFDAAGARRLTVVAGDSNPRGSRSTAPPGGTTSAVAAVAGAMSTWSSTVRAALLLATCAVGIGFTILALGYADLNGYALILALSGLAAVLLNTRPPWRHRPWMSQRRSGAPPIHREDVML
jgi:hypothetical protein